MLKIKYLVNRKKTMQCNCITTMSLFNLYVALFYNIRTIFFLKNMSYAYAMKTNLIKSNQTRQPQ